ncbi:MAG: NDP-hexose 2,3-dehydratase family protein [Paludibacteraceae bacterium]|nr:NDP-hexose 2,3-dehydratase family protein [Paludibacteraceae bacterium]
MKNHKLDFMMSALHHGTQITTGEILAWMKQKNDEIAYELKQVPLSTLKGWNDKDDHIAHDTGKFFSIQGLRIQTNYGKVPTWDQPIINQPEIGFLGFIVQKKDRVLHFLMQAKIEPGNLNVVQLSPTLQATKSNYTRVHQGRAPRYLEYFTGEKQVEVLVDQLQSEQGARFYQKRNRNIIVEVPEEKELPMYDNFIWVTLGQIKELLNYPNVINMDSRTVISCIQYGDYTEKDLLLLSAFRHLSDKSRADSFFYSILSSENHYRSLNEILHWITSLKCEYEISVDKIGLSEMRHWVYDGNTIEHEQKKYFSVIGVDVSIGNREVTTWSQPMVKSAQEGLMGFLVKKIKGIYHFLVQAKLEPGNFDILEMAPTVQCLTGNYRKGQNEYTIPYLECFMNAKEEQVWYSAYQSEEGGRFFKEQNLNMIVEVGEEFPLEVERNYCWMTLNQLQNFVTYNNYLNIGARSLLSAIQFYDAKK